MPALLSAEGTAVMPALLTVNCCRPVLRGRFYAAGAARPGLRGRGCAAVAARPVLQASLKVVLCSLL